MPVSFNRTSSYFIDSLTGRSESTKEAYDKDLQQFKAYLVVYRSHLICEGNLDLVHDFRTELDKSGGKLTDTRYLERHYRTEIKSQALLDQFDLDLSKLAKADIVGYFGYLESTRRLSRSTLLRRLTSLKRFFAFLAKEKILVATEIMERLDDMQLKRERKLPIALDLDEVLEFLSLIDDPRDRALILVMVYMGLRISEVVQLNAQDITNSTEGVTIYGKGNKERYVPIHPVAKEAVLVYKSIRPESVPDELGDPLFLSNRRRRIDPSTVRKMIKAYAAKTEQLDHKKRERLSPHKFRHTFATLLLQGDVDIRFIQELLGHEHLSTTEIYTSVVRKDLEKAISRHPLGQN